MQVLLETNALLEKLGFGSRSFEDYDDLVASVSSMAVALYEKLFQFHLEEIIRVPETSSDYVHNAQRVVDALSGALLDESFDTTNLTGDTLCDGDAASIQQLVRMFAHIQEILYGDDKPVDVQGESREQSELEREYPRTRPPSKGKTAPAKHMEVRSSQRPTPTHHRTNTNSRTPLSAPTRRTNANNRAPASAYVIKKRSRRTPLSAKSAPTLRRKDTTLEEELLTTQKYGRYVPVPRDRHQHQHTNDNGDGLSDADDAPALGEAGETYFGGMSSVSGASGSSASIHFMEEEGEFARNFSAIQSHSSPGTDSKDSPEVDATPNRSTTDNTPPPKSRNQQDADEEFGNHRQNSDDSPVKKKLATTVTNKKTTHQQSVMSPPNKPQAAAATKENKKPPLYPLLPETARHDKASKAYNQHLRYKLQLKDHLQELRHRELCQRQHLERAYRLGEHAANVERIRTRRFEQELRLHRIAIGLEAKTQEETQLRVAMQHLLHLEKEKLQDEHQTTKQMLKTIQSEHAEREQALENFYATQIQLVREQTRRELVERETVERAHRLASKQMIREMRRDRERELESLLKEKQHLAEVRRFKRETILTRAIEGGTDVSTKHGDAFYAAAMKVRQLRAKGPAQATNKPSKARVVPMKSRRTTVVRV